MTNCEISTKFMSSRLRKLSITSHVTSSAGWLSALAAYLVLAPVGLTSRDSEIARAAYRAMEVVGWGVIVPCALAALPSGVIQSLGTEWGLLRHDWIVAKLALTAGATAVLLMHVATVSHMTGSAVATTLSSGDFRLLRVQLVVHAVGGLVVLLTATTLSLCRPWSRSGHVRARTAGEMSAR